jgi:CheY-like chemotaxis protein
MEILIVDDDKISRLLFRAILEKAPNCTVSEAVDGQNAWEMLTNGFVADLVVTDITMPRLNGIELLKRIRGDERFKSLHVIMSTAIKDRAMIEEASKLGTDYYLLKPFWADKVLDQIRRVEHELSKRSPIEDPATTQKRLGIDEPTYYKFLWLLTEQIQLSLPPVGTAAAQANWAEAEYRLNSLAGAVMNLGLPDLSRAIAASEQAIRATDDTAISFCLKRVEWENQRVMAALPNREWTRKPLVGAEW